MTNKNQRILGSLFPTLLTSEMFKQVDDFLQEAFSMTDLGFAVRGHPRGDIFVNKDGNLVMSFALAGYSKEQLSVSVSDNKITISATKADPDETSGGSIARRGFSETFTEFAHAWDLNSADVSYKDGLLKVIILPRSKKEKEVKNINIK